MHSFTHVADMETSAGWSINNLSKNRLLMQATNLIISHMAKEPLELFWWPFTLLLVNIANSHFQLISPALFAWACAGIALGAYLHYVFSVSCRSAALPWVSAEMLTSYPPPLCLALPGNPWEPLCHKGC